VAHRFASKIQSDTARQDLAKLWSLLNARGFEKNKPVKRRKRGVFNEVSILYRKALRALLIGFRHTGPFHDSKGREKAEFP
jgi:hypothetical protein